MSAPDVLEALTVVANELKKPEKPIIVRDAALDIIDQFQYSFKAQVMEDISKSLPKGNDEIKAMIGEQVAVYESGNETPPAIKQISDALKTKNDPSLANAINVLSALGSSRGR